MLLCLTGFDERNEQSDNQTYIKDDLTGPTGLFYCDLENLCLFPNAWPGWLPIGLLEKFECSLSWPVIGRITLILVSHWSNWRDTPPFPHAVHLAS